MSSPAKRLPPLSPATGWVPTRLKYLLASSRMGAFHISQSSLLPALKPSEAPSPEALPVVVPSDITGQPSMVTLQAPVHSVFHWFVPQDTLRAPAGSLLVVYDPEGGRVMGCKIAGSDTLVLPSVLVLEPKSGVDARWLRHALAGVEAEPVALGYGHGLEALLQQKLPTPSLRDQGAIAQYLDQIVEHAYETEVALRRSADLVAENRRAVVRSVVAGVVIQSSLPPVLATASAIGAPTTPPIGAHRPR